MSSATSMTCRIGIYPYVQKYIDETWRRSVRSIARSIDRIDRFDRFGIFSFVRNFSKDRLRRDDRFRPKIVQIRAILAIFRPFEDFCDFRFGRFGIAFGSIDMASEGRGGPPWYSAFHG